MVPVTFRVDGSEFRYAQDADKELKALFDLFEKAAGDGSSIIIDSDEAGLHSECANCSA